MNTRTLIAVALVAALTGCVVKTEPAERPAAEPATYDLSNGIDDDDVAAALAWFTYMTPAERSDACTAFWMLADSEIHDILTTPPDALTSSEADAMIDLMWEEC